MQLIKSTPTKGEDGENIYTDQVLMISDDPSALKAKAHDLCREMGINPESWHSRHPIMGIRTTRENYDKVMILGNGIGFIIEK